MILLVLHGPNLNLLGVRSARAGERVTLDKVNTLLRSQARELGVELKILQTHDLARALTFIQRNRNRAGGLLLTPGPWAVTAHEMVDLLLMIAQTTVEIRLDGLYASLPPGTASVFDAVAASSHRGHPLAVFPKALADLARRVTTGAQVPSSRNSE